MQPLTAVHFFVLWKSNLGGSLTSFESHKLWPFSCLINTRRSLKQQLTEAFGRLSWLPFNAKSSWIRNYVLLKVLWFICFSQVVDHVALEIKEEEEERQFLILRFQTVRESIWIQSPQWCSVSESDLLLKLSRTYQRCFGGKNSIKKYINGCKISQQFTWRYCKQLIRSTQKQPIW